MNKLFLLIFASVILLTACKDNSTTPSKSDVIWPLAVGNVWTYQHAKYDTLGNVLSTSPEIMSVILDTMINNEHQYFIKDIIDTFPATLSVTNRTDSLWINSSKDPCNPSVLFFKYPVNNGEQFYCTQLNDTMTVESTNEKITTKYGQTYTIIKYIIEKILQTSYSSTIYYMSPGYGLIRFETYTGDSKATKKISKDMELTVAPVLK